MIPAIFGKNNSYKKLAKKSVKKYRFAHLI